MQSVVFNGSPRGEKGSTAKLIDCFVDGMTSVGGHEVTLRHLARKRHRADAVSRFRTADAVIIAYPLYTDAMPAMVKTLIEDLRPLVGSDGLPSLGFFVQSGFPEAHHSRFVERYHERPARRLGVRYLGTMIRGNCNRLELQPGFVTKPLFARVRALGVHFGKTGEFDRAKVKKLAGPEHLGWATKRSPKLTFRTSQV